MSLIHGLKKQNIIDVTEMLNYIYLFNIIVFKVHVSLSFPRFYTFLRDASIKTLSVPLQQPGDDPL